MMRLRPLAMLAAIACVLAACGGGDSTAPGSVDVPIPSFRLGGTVSGLAGSGLILQVAGGTDLGLAPGTSAFTFLGFIRQGVAYTVSVKAQPTNPAQTCTVTNGTGTMGGADVATVSVTCVSAASVITLGGTIMGLEGDSLRLQNNGVNDLWLKRSAASFTFPGVLAAGASYNVTIGSQPFAPWQTCTVSSGAGSATAAVSTVAIRCTTNPYTVAGSISGLAGTGLTLKLNDGTPVAVAANAKSFVFPAIPSLTTYTLSVATQPTSPTQVCVVTSAGGSFSPVAGAQSQVSNINITNASIDCASAGIAVGGTISGLGANGLTLKLNGGVPLPVPSGATAFSFAAGVPTGQDYSVTITGQPTGQTCTLLRAKGTKTAQVVGSVGVKCLANITSPLSGTFTLAAGGYREYLTFWPDGTFTHASRAEDNNCQDRGNNIEYGIYNYNAVTSAFRFADATTDADGQCGFAKGGGANFGGTAVRIADTLALTSAITGRTQKWVLVASVPSSLVGSFSVAPKLSDGIDGSFAVFQPDNTYIVVTTQQEVGGPNSIGYERACYTITGSNFTTATSATACLPDGKPVVITNGGSIPPGTPTPFSITGVNTVTVNGDILLRRIVPN